MKKLSGLILITILLISETNGQGETVVAKVDSANQTTNEKFYVVDKTAEFPGGFSNFYGKYILKNLKYPDDARQLGIEGKVQVQFVIESTGEIRQESVVVKQGIHASCDNEAVRLIKESPKWKPAFSTELNKNVAQRLVIPINFKLK